MVPANTETAPRQAGVLLAVDDCQLIRKIIRHIAERMGMTVHTAADAASALAQIAQLKPDLITLDGELPGMSGLECLAQIRGRWPHIPVLMVSGHNEHAFVVSCLRNGASDYLIKPFSRLELEKKIQRILPKVNPAAPPLAVASL